MNYEVFARKYRPQTFDDLVGQTHVSRTLKNAVAQNRLAHAYLFVGPRGVGKTSTARILAKSLNCINGPTITPCGVCDNCREIAGGNSLDVIEIDGASNNSVEDVRQLRENVRYAPAKGRYKIYHHRRGAHAFAGRIQRPFEDVGRTARARQIYFRYDRAASKFWQPFSAVASDSICIVSRQI